MRRRRLKEVERRLDALPNMVGVQALAAGYGLWKWTTTGLESEMAHLPHGLPGEPMVPAKVIVCSTRGDVSGSAFPQGFGHFVTRGTRLTNEASTVPCPFYWIAVK